jgi:hypothetical protein
MPPHEHGDRLAALADHHHRMTGLDGDALGGAMPGTRLVGGDRRIGDEVDVRSIDHLGRGVGDHRTVHLGEFRETGGSKVGAVEMEPTGADGLDVAPVAEHHERAGLLAEDQFDGIAQRSPRSEGAPDIERLVLLSHPAAEATTQEPSAFSGQHSARVRDSVSQISG